MSLVLPDLDSNQDLRINIRRSDREHAADDAEYSYRWIRSERTYLNAWFPFRAGRREWQRLRTRTLRLVAPGLRRRLLLLNAEHVARRPDYAFGKLVGATYGDAMNKRSRR